MGGRQFVVGCWLRVSCEIPMLVPLQITTNICIGNDFLTWIVHVLQLFAVTQHMFSMVHRECGIVCASITCTTSL